MVGLWRNHRGRRRLNLRTVGIELSALGASVVSLPGALLPWRVLGNGLRILDPHASHRVPVVFVHGFLGAPGNFVALAGLLWSRGVRSLTAFSYAPSLDFRRVAAKLDRFVADVREATGEKAVDLVGHSFGGLAARYHTTVGGGWRSVRRLITLGSPYSPQWGWSHEVAFYGERDLLVPPAPITLGRRVVVPDCGHWGLLYHPSVLRGVVSALQGDAPD